MINYLYFQHIIYSNSNSPQKWALTNFRISLNSLSTVNNFLPSM
ncbi:protein of unknown function [Candidatus Nitrotoga arctica]|uniref:Uncharacterized protein n=1 Tax=Candidatus Nitrotoga arctica TaxID=453162 RepID=A0ABN8AP28_9PROT|nr:protein of unknown function [Candidatus Nitrotoga arctica]